MLFWLLEHLHTIVEFKSRRGKNKNSSAQRSNSNTVWYVYITNLLTKLQRENIVPHKTMEIYSTESSVDYQIITVYIVLLTTIVCRCSNNQNSICYSGARQSE
jgi:hypothetical protein